MSSIEHSSEIPISKEVEDYLAKREASTHYRETVYEPNQNLWFGERDEYGKRLIAYTDFAEVAFVDVVELKMVDNRQVLGSLLLRIDGEPFEIVEMLHHPSNYASQEKAELIFGRSKLSFEDTYGQAA